MMSNTNKLFLCVKMAVVLITAVPSTANGQKIAAGSSHNLLIKKDGSLWTWGRNENGQLGNGTTDEKTTPNRVGTDSNWQTISGGEAHSVAIKTNGTLWAWGKNEFGRLGDGTTEDKLVPTQIGVDANWSKVSAGKEHTLAIKTDGTLWAWGRNEFGQLGDESTEDKTAPVQVGTDTDWAEVSAGYYHSAALKSDGSLWVWGDNRYNYLGDEATVNCIAQAIANPSGDYTINFLDSYGDGWNNAAIKVIIDGDETNYTLEAGSSGSESFSIPEGAASLSFVFVSGEWDSEVTFTIVNSSGKIIASGGPGPTVGVITLYFCDEGKVDRKTRPVKLNQDVDWSVVSAGNSNTLAVKSNGTLWAWGSNTVGQLGDGTYSTILVPTQIGDETNWAFIMAGADHTLALKNDGSLWAWGSNTFGQLGNEGSTSLSVPSQSGLASNWLSIASGNLHSLATKSDGTVWGWGRNDIGQVGEGTAIVQLTPTRIDEQTDWGKIAAGTQTSMAFKSDKSLWGWGSNVINQFGNGQSGFEALPIQISDLNVWVDFSLRRSHVLALKSDGTLWSWGWNSNGQLGNGTTTTIETSMPIQVGADDNWQSIFAGHYSSFAIKSNGSLWAWGSNNFGGLGDGTTQYKTTPVQVGSDIDWTSVSEGRYHTIGLKMDGTIWSWGHNQHGQLGDGTTSNSTTPNQIGTDNNWEVIFAGFSNSFAIKTDGTLWAWGLNENGVLGDGTSVNKSTPVQIGFDTDWAKVNAGFSHCLAIKEDGTLWAWGSNFGGEIGNGTQVNQTSPVQIGDANDWQEISGGGSHSMAVKSDGTLWVWGSNHAGQLGEGSALKRSPQLVKTPMDILISKDKLTSGQVASEVGAFSIVNGSDGYAPNLTLATGVGDTDNASFAIQGGSLVTATTLDLQAKPTYSIRVQATDEFGNSFAKVFTINRANSAPTALILDGTEVNENVQEGTIVGTLTSTDADVSDTHTYTLVAGEGDSGNGSFTIEGNQLLTAASINYETTATYKVRIQTKDAVGATFSAAFTIALVDANDAPTDLTLSKTEFSENRAIGEELATISTKDEDKSDIHTYALVAGEGDTDNALFAIKGDKLAVNGGLDFESKPTLTIRVQTTDGGQSTFIKSFTLTISNANDAPSDITLSANVISETLVGGKQIGEFSVIDQDAGDNHTLSLVAGDGDTDNALFSLEEKKLVTGDAISGAKKESYSVRVQAKDLSDGLFSKAFTIDAQNIKSPQEISFSLPESVYPDEPPMTLVATATSGLPVTFEVVSGSATIDGDKLTLEGAGVVEVKATQSGNDAFLPASITQTLTVNPFLVLTVTVSKVDESMLSEGNAKLLTPGGDLVKEATVSEGAVQLSDLKPGLYILQVAPAGDAAAAVSETFYPSVPSLDLAEVIDLSVSTSLNMTMIDSPVAGFKEGAGHLTIFPNPAEGELWVSLGTEQRQNLEHVYVYSFAGAYVGEFAPRADSRGIVIDIDQTIKPGTYILRLEFKDGVSIGKFVKQ